MSQQRFGEHVVEQIERTNVAIENVRKSGAEPTLEVHPLSGEVHVLRIVSAVGAPNLEAQRAAAQLLRVACEEFNRVRSAARRQGIVSEVRLNSDGTLGMPELSGRL